MTDTYSLHTRAWHLYGLKRYALAIETLDRLLHEHSDYSPGHSLLAHCYLSLGDTTRARSAAQKAIETDPADPEAYSVLAAVYDKGRQPDEAKAAAREAIRLAPDDPDYHAQLAGMLLSENAHQEALERAEEALQLDAQHEQGTFLRCYALVELERTDSAVRAIQDALRMCPTSSWLHELRGYLNVRLGQGDAAFSAYQEALRLNPESATAREGILNAIRTGSPFYRWWDRVFYRLLQEGYPASAIGVAVLWFSLRVYFAVAFRAGFTPGIDAAVAVAMVFVGPVMLSVIASRVMEIGLRSSRLGRLALTSRHVYASYATATCLAFSVAACALAAVLRDSLWALGALYSLIGIMAASLFLYASTPRAMALVVLTSAAVIGLFAGALWSLSTLHTSRGILLFLSMGTPALLIAVLQLLKSRST